MSAPQPVLEAARTEDEIVSPRAWRTLAWSSLAVFMAILDGTVLFVAFPSIGRSFPAVSAADLSWILNAYTIVYGSLLVPAGRMADRLGRRRIFLGGVALFALASLAAGLAPSPAIIIAARILQAIGAAMLTPSSLALLLAAFPRSKRSVAVGLWAAVGALAAAVGPSAGSGIIQLGGWRWAFFVNLPVALVLLVRGSRVLEESRDTNAEGVPDAVGILQLIAGMALVALAVVRGRDWGPSAALACIAVGIALLILFVRRSSRVAFPALDVTLFEVPSFRYANIATLVYGATFSAMFLGSVLFLTIGFALAGWAETENQVPAIAQLITLPQFFFSGVFFSKDAAPEIIRPVTNLLPLTFLTDALREISVQGATIWDVRAKLLGLVIWTAIGLVLAVRFFRFDRF